MIELDTDGRVQSLTAPGLQHLSYAYNTTNTIQGYGYDTMDRLTSANQTGGMNQGFTWDKASNCLTKTVNGAATTSTLGSTSHWLTALSGAEPASLGYDAIGNQTSDSRSARTYAWDAFNRLALAKDGATEVGCMASRAGNKDGYP